MATPFQTVRQAANSTGLSQKFLRDGCKAGEIPHVKSGTRFLINVPELMEALKRSGMKDNVGK